MRSDDESRGLHRALHGTGEGDRDRFAGQTLAEESSLIASAVGEQDIDSAGEAIFGAQLGGAVTDEVDARGHARILPENKEARDLWSREPILGSLTSTRGHSNRLCLRSAFALSEASRRVHSYEGASASLRAW